MLAFTRIWAAKLALTAVLAHLLVEAAADAGLSVRAGTVAPNQNCEQDSDCRSNHCIPYDPHACSRLNPDGSYADNRTGEGNYFENYCSGVGIGQACANQGECGGGRCNAKHKCTTTFANSTACLTDLGCSGAQVCRNKKCYAPPSRSLAPLSSCKADSSCRSGRCTTNLPNRWVNEGNYTSLLECDSFAMGERGCTSIYECYDALCLNMTSSTGGGICKLGSSGDRCAANFQCSNTCSLEGVCFTPAKASLSKYEPCKDNSVCLSNDCDYNRNGDNHSVQRPDPTVPSYTITYTDKYCHASVIGGTCRASSDCVSGARCTNGVCVGTAK